jgi:PAS domain S-box-containing protein
MHVTINSHKMNRLAKLLARMREGYAELDGQRRFTLVNPAAERLLGLPASQILGKRWPELFPPNFADSLESRFSHAANTREAILFEQNLDTATKRIAFRVQRDGTGFVLFFEDVTSLRSLELSLKQESEQRRIIEERFETALSVNQIVVFKMDRNLRYSWVYNNQIGLRDNDTVGKTPDAFFDAESARRLSTFFRLVLTSGQAQRTELALRARHSTVERHFVSSARPLFNANQEVIGLTGASIEITSVVRQREELGMAREEAVIAKAEAERASLSKSKFLAAASHDLRQPVQSLLLLIEVLKTRLAGSPIQKAVDHMEEAVDALRLLFDSMLDISRLDAGLVVPVLQTVSLNALLGRLAEEYRLRAEHQSLEFRLVSTSAHTRTDPVLVERVLRNLIENALRYCPSGRVLLGCRRQGKTVRIDVIDTGIGIAPNHLNDIFEEFHQVANAARDRSQGLGLGLSIVERAMRLLGGTVTVRSRLGSGSCFSITLPLANRQETSIRDSGSHTEGGGRLVLIIENDRLLRDSLDMMLRNWGYVTMTACSGEDALTMIDDHRLPDAILADYRLSGGLTGTKTVLQISQTTGHPIPSVIITGDTAPERVREVHGSGLHILHKPVAADELRRALLGMLREHSNQ